MDGEGKAFFRLGEHTEPDLSVIPGKDGQWQEIFLTEERSPFDLKRGPLFRSYLLPGKDRPIIILVCHHLICDGISMSYLFRDLFRFLENPHNKDEKPLPVNIISGIADLPTLPLKGASALITNWLNSSWKKEKVVFGEEDYQAMAAGYWQNCEARIDSRFIPQELVQRLRIRCQSNGVTVNSAILTAFSEARRTLQGDAPLYSYKTGFAINVREKLANNPGEGIGNFASGASVTYKYNPKTSFWENARNLHNRIGRILNSEEKKFLVLHFLLALEPTLLDAMYFHMFTDYRDKTVSRLAGFLGFKKKRQGLGVTNLGVLDLEKEYGPYGIEEVYLVPTNPTNSDGVCGVATSPGGMGLVLLYREEKSEQSLPMDRVLNRVVEVLQKAAAPPTGQRDYLKPIP